MRFPWIVLVAAAAAISPVSAGWFDFWRRLPFTPSVVRATDVSAQAPVSIEDATTSDIGKVLRFYIQRAEGIKLASKDPSPFDNEGLAGIILGAVEISFPYPSVGLYFSCAFWDAGDPDVPANVSFSTETPGKLEERLPSEVFKANGALRSEVPINVFNLAKHYAVFWAYDAERPADADVWNLRMSESEALKALATHCTVKELTSAIKAMPSSDGSPDTYGLWEGYSDTILQCMTAGLDAKDRQAGLGPAAAILVRPVVSGAAAASNGFVFMSVMEPEFLRNSMRVPPPALRSKLMWVWGVDPSMTCFDKFWAKIIDAVELPTLSVVVLPK